jgi:hypothetical protein
VGDHLHDVPVLVEDDVDVGEVEHGVGHVEVVASVDGSFSRWRTAS